MGFDQQLLSTLWCSSLGISQCSSNSIRVSEKAFAGFVGVRVNAGSFAGKGNPPGSAKLYLGLVSDVWRSKALSTGNLAKP